MYVRNFKLNGKMIFKIIFVILTILIFIMFAIGVINIINSNVSNGKEIILKPYIVERQTVK